MTARGIQTLLTPAGRSVPRARRGRPIVPAVSGAGDSRRTTVKGAIGGAIGACVALPRIDGHPSALPAKVPVPFLAALPRRPDRALDRLSRPSGAVGAIGRVILHRGIGGRP